MIVLELPPPWVASPLPSGITLFLTAKHMTLKFLRTLSMKQNTISHES